MVDKKAAREIVANVLARAKRAGADEAEVHLGAGREALTRFANNEVHQNVESEVADLALRLVYGKRTARTSTTKLDEKGLEELVQRTAEVAKITPEDKNLLPVLGRDVANTGPESNVDDATAASTPEQRAESVKKVLAIVEKAGFVGAGYLSCSSGSLGGWGAGTWIYGNSAGLVRSYERTHAGFSLTVQGKDSSGWAEASSPSLGSFDLEAMAARAVEKCRASANPGEIEPGAYDVILEPAAVRDLGEFLFWGGFTGREYEEGSTWSAGFMGKKIFDEKITIKDDWSDARNPGPSWDEEGHPRSKLVLVDKGVMSGLCWDRRSAKEHDTVPTGHGWRAPNLGGGGPSNVVMEGGATSLDDMIKQTKRGVLVTHFWYNRLVDMKRVIVTGMTRDGTFLVEDGKIKQGVRNMRFNQSVLDMLANVLALGPVDPSFMVPAMKVKDFHFSSKTRF
ncbi:MAG TPA: TldD/PmbA family protein [Planctomycetota bacterium]|nr:TldD/PmbA family protein [Planctomycetota bacterium]